MMEVIFPSGEGKVMIGYSCLHILNRFMTTGHTSYYKGSKVDLLFQVLNFATKVSPKLHYLFIH